MVAWAACADPGRADADGADVVLGSIGPFGRLRRPGRRHRQTAPARPPGGAVGGPGGRRDWRVPVVEVKDAIRAACRRWRLLGISADPTAGRARSSCWTPRASPPASSRSHPSAWAPATTRLSAATATGCCPTTGRRRWRATSPTRVVKEDSRGGRLAKEHKDAKRRIDAAVMAYDRATVLAGDRARRSTLRTPTAPGSPSRGRLASSLLTLARALAASVCYMGSRLATMPRAADTGERAAPAGAPEQHTARTLGPVTEL